MTKHKDIIRDLAHKIDNTENDVITIIQNVQQIKEVAEEETVVDNTLKNIEKQKNKNYFMKTDNGVIKLTKDVNEPRIDEVLS
jgi:hypothetical protein